MKKNRETNFDKKLEKELNLSVKNTFPSCDLKRKIGLEISNQENTKKRGEVKMKKSRIGVVLAAAVVLCVSVFAIGKYTGTISSSSSHYNYTSYEDTTKAEQKAGFEAIIPEKLGEYKFDGITMEKVADIDDSGNKFNNRKAIDVDYKNENGDVVILNIDKWPENYNVFEENEYQEIKEYNGVKFHYAKIESLFIASEDDMTPEEKQRSESDPFFNVGIGGPSQGREKSISNHLTFEIDGIGYSLMGFENVDANELFEMGQEFVK